MTVLSSRGLFCRLAFIATVLLLTSQAGLAARGQTDELALCGWDEVYILRFKSTLDNKPEKIWSWKADRRSGLPDSMWARFENTDDCKTAPGGQRVVITASTGGIAVVERKSGRATFFATVYNAHSAELLPDSLLAVAASHVPEGTSDRLIIFDLRQPGLELASDPLPWGHGVFWDAERQLLFALSNTDIRIYKLIHSKSDSLRLARQALIALPESGGHDLYPVPGTEYLSVSTGSHCWLFDRRDYSISPHPVLADSSRIKSICVSPVSGRLSWTRAESEQNWWTALVPLRNPEGLLNLTGQRLYKARWVNPE